MILSDNNIKLIRLTENDLELVRKWRNDPKISQFMFFQGHITEEMQIEWFKKINNNNNYYFIIEIDREKIGLTEIKNINYENMNAEAGIFIYNDDYLNGILSYKIIFLLMNFAFDKLKIKQFNVLIRDDNKRAIRFNNSIGYLKNEKLGQNYYSLNQENYKQSKVKIEKILK